MTSSVTKHQHAETCELTLLGPDPMASCTCSPQTLKRLRFHANALGLDWMLADVETLEREIEQLRATLGHIKRHATPPHADSRSVCEAIVRMANKALSGDSPPAVETSEAPATKDEILESFRSHIPLDRPLAVAPPNVLVQVPLRWLAIAAAEMAGMKFELGEQKGAQETSTPYVMSASEEAVFDKARRMRTGVAALVDETYVPPPSENGRTAGE